MYWGEKPRNMDVLGRRWMLGTPKEREREREREREGETEKERKRARIWMY